MKARFVNTMYIPVSATLIFFAWHLVGSPCFASESTMQAAPFVWWSVGTQKRLSDGRTEQALTLAVSPIIAIERPEAWLRLLVPRLSQANWYKADWSSSEPFGLVVQSDEYLMADVFARAEIGGRPHFAQTRLTLYGQGKDTGRERESLGDDPGWPQFRVRSDGTYWPQTGDAFSLSVSGAKADGCLEIRDPQGELVAEVRASEDVYTYTPLHDPALNRAGPSASKPLIFVARLDEGGAASFTQLVHRSRYGLRDKKAGLAIFALAILASCLTAWRIRRKARPCC